MTDNVIYGRFIYQPRLDIIQKMDDINSKLYEKVARPSFPKSHWSHRYVAVGDLAAAATTLEGMLSLLSDDDFQEIQKFISGIVYDLGEAVFKEAMKRREEANASA